jgi:hypothetical protein
MSITVDEVTAEVAPSERGAEAPPRRDGEPPKPSDLRRQREVVERMQQRMMRVFAD